MNTSVDNETLLARKRRLLEMAKAAKLQQKDEQNRSIGAAPRGAPLPLSFAQQRLWFIDQFEPGNAFYNIPLALRLSGALNEQALQQSLNEIVRRHEALRTTFIKVDGVPLQRFADTLALPLARTGLMHVAAAEREAAAQALVQREADTPFDLAEGPLLRASLITLSETEHLFLVTFHHIVSDGWSMAVFIGELAALYGANVAGQPSPLAPLAIQYADFAHWQRQWLGAGVLAQQLSYWKERLAGAPALLALPTDRPRPALQNQRGAVVDFTVPAATVEALRALNKQTQATMFMTLAAAFNVLLARYCGQDDICIGTPIANRNRAEVEPLIGFFVNTLVLRTQVDAGASFLDLLAQVRATALGAYAHQDVPFEQLIEAINPERQSSYAPLFQVMFSLQNDGGGSFELPGLTFATMSGERVASKFDLSLSLNEVGDELRAQFEYKTDLFDAASIERMARHFARLLAALAADPAIAVGEAALLDERERAQLLVEWNDTATSYPDQETIHALFERQCARDPGATAVVFKGQSLSYGELNARANQLAHHLRTLGVGPDVMVGICVDRSLDMIVGLLGILKSGGAYLPLDPTYPQERLAFMLEDAAPAVLLTQGHLAARLPGAGIATLCLDTDAPLFAAHSRENPPALGLPHNLAYIIYTSGSTGRPKGVAVGHQAVSRLVFDTAYIDLRSSDTVAQAASNAFDATTFEVWGALLQGCKLCLVDPDLVMSPSAFADEIARENISALFITTALFNQFALQAPTAFANMRYVLFGGEAVTTGLVEVILNEGAPEHLVHVYGPTESTTFALSHFVDKNARDLKGLPIGKPIGGTQAYVLDAAGNPVAPGVAGELHIGGDGLARGYLKRPDMTAEKFVPNPFGAPGSRMYRTGDLVRFLANGDIDYMGRIDSQVKIRGFRIEPGEIEVVLAALPGVREALVMVREDTPGDKRLAAYVVWEEGAQVLDAPGLRAALQHGLPDYMVPSHFIAIDAFPLTPNGKTDRRALPAPDTGLDVDSYVAPRNPTEEIVAGIWADVLGREQVGVHDNFFSLGGHSLLATQVMSKLRAAFGVELPLRAVFEEPTVAQLAQRTDEALAQKEGLSIPAITPMPRGAALAPLSFAQQRLWFVDQFDPGQPFYNMPLALRLTGDLNLQALRGAVAAIVARHDALRTSFVKVDGTPRQRVADALDLPLAVNDLSILPEAERMDAARALLQAEARAAFDLAAGPLVRAGLLRLSADDHLFLFTFHHIVSDGWSLGVFIKELGALYGAFAAGLPSPLAPLPIQYADFAHWQREWLSGAVLDAQLAYWKDKLSGAPALLALPTDRPRPPVQTHNGSLVEFTIPAPTVAGLRALNKQAQTTMFMTLAAAFNVLLARYSGQNDICIGTPIANRNRVETEPLIGFFVNTLVLRTELDLEASFLALLAQVRATALGAYAHQDVPFEQLIEVLNPERQTSYSPLFQVLFALQNAAAGELALPGLTLGALPSELGTAKFDLSLSVDDDGEQLLAAFEYNTDLFDAETVSRMAQHFTQLLAAAVHAPGTALGDLQLLGTEEREQLLAQWNTAGSYPAEHTIHALFEQQAARHPDAVAVVCDGAQLSYAQLGARSNQLARHLRTLGVGPDVLVGICVERSLDMVVGLLAILKAGGAYVPLDPSYPAERLAYMLADSAPAVLLTETALRGHLPAGGQPVLCLDQLGDALADLDCGDLAHETSSDNLAYVIYTSGSTGKPKGALLQHSNVMRLFAATSPWFDFDERDVWTVFHSYGFDFSVWEIWGALLHGAKLVVVPYMVSRSPEQFHALLAREQVTVLNQTPSAFQQLVDYDLAQAAPAQLHLRSVIFGGEALNQAALAPWFARHGDRKPQLINMYGITETTVHVTYQPLIAAPSERTSIGVPIPDLATYILDARFNPVPVGVAGELYVAGAGLARGYLRRADLSAERFVPNPYGEPGSRMYRSGDLARYLPDGRMEYLGRIDTQVKIRGFRIELSEIEAALAAVPGVRETLVLVREDTPGDKRLAAYLAWDASAEQLDAGALRTALLRTLPDYMVPVYFISIAQFPLTGNGKIDRRALPAPDFSRSEDSYVAPRTAAEEVLAAIWADVLKLDRVGVHDNFFALGGHSLLAVSLIERMRNAGMATEIRVLFGTPTIAALAESMGTRREVVIPPNGIPAGCTAIEPSMLTLVQLDAAAIAAVCAQAPGGAANIQDIYPLAPLQEGILFHHLMDPGAASYVTPMLLGFDSRARLDGFMAALQATIDRHDILRTVVLWDGLPEPLQAVLRRASIRIDEVQLPEDCLDIAAALRTLGGAGIDLERAPLMRAVIAHEAQSGRWLLQLLAHHLVLDHTTLDILLSEVHAIMGGQGESLPVPLPFRNFVGQTRLGVSAAQHEAFFRGMLADIVEPTVPYGLQEVQGHSGASDEARLLLDPGLSRRLRQQARKLGVSVASVMHLAYAQVLSRVSGQQDVVFGSVLFGRMDSGAGSDRVLGMFINTLPVRIAIAGQSAVQGVRAAHALLARLLEHEHASLALAQRCSGVEAPTPLFSSLLNYRHSQVGAPDDGNTARAAWPGVEMIGAEESSNYPFALSVDDLGEDFHLSAQVDGRIEAVKVCAYMHAVLEQLAEALEHNPDAPVAGMDVMPAAEQHRLLVEWNDTATAYPDQDTIHSLFERQCARNPSATAVVYKEQALSYGELNARANQLAHHLRGLGVGPDVMVGICVERSLDMIVGLLGILKSGGAYLPLDPTYPAERLQFMLEDAAPVVLLTQQRLAARLPAAAAAVPVLCLDTDAPRFAAHSRENPPALGLPHNLAYIIYTSGSTGRPKGVAVGHQAVSRLVFDTAYIDLHSSDTVAQAASNAFDATTFEVWGALLQGCKLCLVDPDLVMSPSAFAAEIAREKISALFITTALFNQFALHAPTAFANMRYVLFGGEAVTTSLVEVILEQGAPQHLVHVYGPTESTTFALSHFVDKTARDMKGLAIGKPIGGTQAYVLDAAGNLAPPGVAGELHIAGDGLARGYLKRPDMTAEKFVPNPFGAPGSRMYRTGDLVRFLANGDIDYLGRIDTQVKIRGFRIELGEIETALAGLPGVREALVLAREDSPGDKRLAAYLVWEEGAQQLEVAHMRSALQKGMPDYMVPAHFMAVDAFPLTANGKIDRRALPAPDTARSESGYVAPRTQAEAILAGIWAELLKLDKVGVHDNVFALGAHSLMATQVMSKLRSAFQVELPLRSVFEEPTVAQLAAAVESARSLKQGGGLPAIVPVAAEGVLPLSFAQQRLWFVDQFAPGKSFYNMPMALRLTGQLHEGALRAAVAEIVRRHAALRTTFAKVDGVPLQRIAQSLELPMALADLSSLPAAEREAQAMALVQAEAQAPFDLAAGPLIRAGLVRIAAGEHLFLVTFHHIVSDGWSMGVFINELAALYRAFVDGRSSPLPELAIQYADFAHWQRQWLSGEVLDGQLSYWKGRLAGAPALLALPTDRARPPVQTHHGAVVDFTIPASTVAALHALNRQAQTTMFMALMAAFNVLLARYSGQDDICIGTPIANRNRAEVEPLIGFFVNTLVLRTEVDGGASFLDLLAQVRAGALGAYAHQDVPFEQLIEALNPERQSSYSPLFQVMFALQNAPAGELALPGLTLGSMASAQTSAKFDLTLNVNEAGEELLASFEYNTDLFDAATIERMARHFTQLLAALSGAPAAAVGEACMLEAREREQALVTWNDTASSYPREQAIHTLFEAQAARDPAALAVVFEDSSLTYSELNARANQLARHLRSAGVGPDVLVGICIERSLEMIVGLLGILKAGGAYLPLDPFYPADRLAYMLDDAAPAMLLTQQHLMGTVPAGAIPTLCLDSQWPQIAVHADGNVDAPVAAVNLAYVIYTSGSTGRPKGAMLQHRGLCNLVREKVAAAAIKPGVRVLQFASFNFDVSTWEIFVSLSSGATICMAARADLMPGPSLEGTMRRLAVNAICMPPVVLTTLAGAELPDLKIIVSGSEACPRSLADALAAKVEQLFNAYGPTETTVYSTATPVFENDAGNVPIGNPIANTQVYILDPAGQPLPQGVAGELHIGGEGLARGYLRRPELTAEKFVPDPFSERPGARMYRTGDLARHLPDGKIEYLGRIDTQLKIRGFRIEPGEIEAALAAVPGVGKALVLAREDVPGDKRLAAYLVWEAQAEQLDAAALRRALLETLPDYMVPAYFIALDKFPLTPSDKIDRRALPAPDTVRSATGYVAPRTPTEETLAAIWAELLKLDRVGVHDNFFASGGHSLLATQVMSKLREALDVELPLQMLFESATLEAFAQKIDQHLETFEDGEV